MKRNLVEVLVCPVCKGKLELKVEVEEKGEIITGLLCCTCCHVSYPITESIPNLLPSESN